MKIRNALVGTMILGLLVAGCGAQTASDKKSDASKLSGKVVVYMPSPAGLSDKLAADFEKKTGVKVEKFQGTTGKIMARLEAEKANPVADVVILASWADGLNMKKAGKLLSYRPAHADKLNPAWIDKDNTIVGTSASAVGVIYNTKLLPKLNADWSELADPEYKNQLAIPDPEKSGACKDFLAGYITSQNNPWQTWEALAKNGLTVPGANKEALEAVTTGEKAILIAGVDYNAYSAKAKGEPLDIYYPKSGTVVNPRPAMIMKTSPNQANAKAFMDYLLSDDAQKLVVNAYLLPGRSDIQSEKRTNLKDIPQFEANWDKMLLEATVASKKLNNICKK